MKKLEAFCDAVAMCNHYAEPESEAYELRNPGLLGDLRNGNGRRVFSCHRAGYAALLDRVQKHCESHPEENLSKLLETLGVKMKTQQENAVDFMSRCASSNALSLTTPLRWFLE